MSDVLVVGTVAYDEISTPQSSSHKQLGGSGMHFSIAAAQLSTPHIVSIVGNDFAENDMQYIQSKGINTDGIEIVDGKTFFWKGGYKGAMNEAETQITDLNVLQQFNPILSDTHANIPYVFLANIDPELQLQVLNQLTTPRCIGIDSMNFWIDSKKNSLLEVLKRVTLITLNDGEAKMLTGEYNSIRAAHVIAAYGPSYVIIKKGEHGSFILHNDAVFSLPALPITDVVDPTGAGDSFAGGVMSYIAHRQSDDWETMKNAIAYGTVMASFNVGAFGPHAFDTITDAEIKKRLDALYSLVHFTR